jgi:hypothetical protein
VVFLALAVHLYMTAGLVIPAFIAFLLSVNLFIGNLIARSKEHNQTLTLH